MMTRPLAAAVLLTAMCVAARAQSPVRSIQPGVPPPTGSADISGTVKDPDGAIVRRATVKISGDMQLERLTVADDDGRFAFERLPAGRFTITAEKAGYPARSYGAKQPYRAGSGVLLQDGMHVHDLVLTLGKGAVIAGTVFDQRGEPMPGVPIMAWQVRRSLAGARTLDVAGPEPDTVITDDLGRYRVYGLPPGEFTVGTSWYFDGGEALRVPTDAEIRAAFQAASAPRSAQPASLPQRTDEQRFSLAPSFVPGVVDPLAAATFTLAAGEVREGVDLRMQLLPMSEIVGTIASADGSPFEVELTIARQSVVDALNTITVRPGMSEKEFRSGSLTPGLYSVMAQSEPTADRPALWAHANVVVSSGQAATVSLVLQPALTVKGRVVFESASLEPPKDPQIQIHLRTASKDQISTTSKIESGNLTTTGVVPGPYRVTGSINGGPATGGWWSLKSVVADGRDVTDRAFEISPGSLQTLTITFTDTTAGISGRLTTPKGAPAPDYFLIVLPADREYWGARGRRIASTRPDRDGYYLFSRLPAGEYLLAVTTDLVPEDLRDAGALEQLAGEAVKVTLAFGERKVLDLRTAGPASDSIVRTLFRDARPPVSSRR